MPQAMVAREKPSLVGILDAMAGQMAVYGGGGAASVGGSNTNSILLQNPKVHGSCEAFDSMFLSDSSPSFLGSGSMVSFEDVNGRKRSGQFFFSTFDREENVDEDIDEYFHQREKKRRLTPDQVQFLEKNFEVDNKLEAERKIQLAKDLGLQPRQVAIWFQNRRARWKTKLLENDYGTLQASYNNLKANYQGLLEENEKLKAEVLQLTNKLRQKEKGNLESSETKKQSQAPPRLPISDSVPEDEFSKVSTEREGKTDYIDGDHSSLLEPGDSSYVFEPDQSEDEEDNFGKNMLPPIAYMFPKIEDADYPAPPANSCCFGFAVEDYTLGLWS